MDDEATTASRPSEHRPDLSRSGRVISIGSLPLSLSALVVSLLSLANDTKSWPFGGPNWITIVFGVLLAAGGACFAVYRQRLEGLTPLLPAISAVLAIAAGTMFATTASDDYTTRSDTDRAAPSAPPTSTTGSPGPVIPGKATIDSLTPGEVVENPIPVSGKVEGLLRPYGSLWIFISNVPTDGGESHDFYLQDGPCSLSDAGDSWSCGNRTVAEIGRRQVRIHIVYARGQAAAELVSKLINGGKYDRTNVCNARNGGESPNPCDLGSEQPDRDPRNLAQIPAGPELDVLHSVTVGLSR